MKNQQMNAKALKFKNYLDGNNLAYFHCNELGDDAHTVIFQSQIPVNDIYLPVGIITDDTIYTIIRVQIAEKVVSQGIQSKLEEYINVLNRNYKVFKYMITEDGSIFLDACLPSSQECFDAEVVRAVLDVIIDHLQKEYISLMNQMK